MGAIKEFYHSLIEENMRGEEKYIFEGIQCVLINTEKGYEIISNDEYHQLPVKYEIIASGWYEELETILRRVKHL